MGFHWVSCVASFDDVRNNHTLNFDPSKTAALVCKNIVAQKHENVHPVLFSQSQRSPQVIKKNESSGFRGVKWQSSRSGSLTSSNEAIQDTQWKPIPYATRWCFNLQKWESYSEFNTSGFSNFIYIIFTQWTARMWILMDKSDIHTAGPSTFRSTQELSWQPFSVG